MSTSLRSASLLLALAGVASGQAREPATIVYHAMHWSTANGLPQNSINDILQTRSGELWLATFAGLVRFDGLEFRVFDYESLPGMPSNRITALTEDDAGALWCGMQSGHVMRIRDAHVECVYSSPIGPAEVIDIAHARDGSLWTLTSVGAVERLADGQWTLVQPPRVLASYHCLRAHPDGSIGVGLGTELMLFDPSGAPRATLVAPAKIVSIAPRTGDGWWIGLEDGLAITAGETIERFTTGADVHTGVTAIEEFGAHTLWLGSMQGPWHLVTDGKAAARVQVASSEVLPSGFVVRTLFRDREANLWVGSNGQGLIRLRMQHAQALPTANARDQVSALVGDGAGGAWVAGGCDGLTHLIHGVPEPKPEPLPEIGGVAPCVQALLRDRQARTWIAVGEFVLRRATDADAEFLPVREGRSMGSLVVALCEASNGSTWIGTDDGRLTQLDARDEVVRELHLDGRIGALAHAPDGSLWISSGNRLFRLRDGRLDSFGREVGVPIGDVRDILPEPDGSAWLASYGGGLCRFADGRVTSISRAQGLPDSALSCMLDDGQGRLWLLSNLGLVVVDRAELVAVATGRKARVDPVVLGPEAGVPEACPGRPAGFRDEDGRLWFGTLAGAVCIDPREFPFNRLPPNVSVEELQADDAPLALAATTRIPAGARRVQFQYTAFALGAPERVHFEYRLVGFDDGWIMAGSARRAAYTALAPGGYTFLVRGRNEDGVWSSTPTSLRIEVLPLWWQTLAFRVAAVVIACGLLFALHRLRVVTLHKRTVTLLQATEGRALAEQRESRMREELAHAGRVATAGELAASLAHEVNQPLAAIVANAQAGRHFLAREARIPPEIDDILRDIAQQGQRASEVIRRLREFLRKRSPARRPLDVNQVVRDTLPLMRRELEQHGVRIVLELDETLPAISGDAVELQQIFVNLIKNACEAMSEHPHPRRIELHTSARDGEVRIAVRDSGPGLAPEVAQRLFQPYVTTKPAGMGLGLPICRSIVEAYGGRLGVESDAQGVTFSVELPAQHSDEVAS